MLSSCDLFLPPWVQHDRWGSRWNSCIENPHLFFPSWDPPMNAVVRCLQASINPYELATVNRIVFGGTYTGCTKLCGQFESCHRISTHSPGHNTTAHGHSQSSRFTSIRLLANKCTSLGIRTPGHRDTDALRWGAVVQNLDGQTSIGVFECTCEQGTWPRSCRNTPCARANVTTPLTESPESSWSCDSCPGNRDKTRICLEEGIF
jgi:hypothetical protein